MRYFLLYFSIGFVVMITDVYFVKNKETNLLFDQFKREMLRDGESERYTMMQIIKIRLWIMTLVVFVWPLNVLRWIFV